MDYDSENIIYLATCKKCKGQYFGKKQDNIQAKTFKSQEGDKKNQI